MRKAAVPGAGICSWTRCWTSRVGTCPKPRHRSLTARSFFFFFFSNNRLYFLEQLQLYRKTDQKGEGIPHKPLPHCVPQDPQVLTPCLRVLHDGPRVPRRKVTAHVRAQPLAVQLFGLDKCITTHSPLHHGQQFNCPKSLAAAS